MHTYICIYIDDGFRVLQESFRLLFAVECVSSVLLWTGNQGEDRVLSKPGDPNQHDRDRFHSNCLYIRINIYMNG